MKTILCSLLLLAIVFSCSKKEAELATTEAVETTARNTPTPDVVYHYQGKTYPLYYQEGSTTEVVQDENALALEALSGRLGDFVTFKFSNQLGNHLYWFDTEFDGYDYMEKYGKKPIIGRRFKVGVRIDELRNELLNKYGENLDYTNPSVYADALEGVEAIYEELKISGDLPRDLEAYVGKKGGQLSINRTPVLKVYEHSNYTGSEMTVETALNTVIWTYGAHGCNTMAANPNLTLEFQPNGNNWNDCISAQCFNYVDGADAMAIGHYKDTDYAVYGCAVKIETFDYTISSDWCYSMFNRDWNGGFCSHMDNQISSIRIKAIWQGCPINFNDMQNQ